MFSEPPLSSSDVLPNATSPISSTSDSPISSASHSRTSTITSSLSQTNHSPQQQQRQMKIGKYLLERTIGKGSFAVVKLATHCETNQKVAIKIVDKLRLDPSDRKKLEREITIMKSLKHPYIIRLYEVMESKKLIYLVTEYAANGELLDLLIREKRLSEPKAKEKFRQLVVAVEYIHSRNVVHRDLKAENLLLDSNGNIKVADFGFANIFEPDSKLKTFCGSPPYAAPELYQCLPYSPEKVDVWCLGVLLYVFVCGHLPFDSNNLAELRKRVLAGQFRLPFYISSDCASLIGHMLTVDPAQRYTIQEIKNHRWLMLTNSNLNDITSQNPSISNCSLTNAILDHAESLGYNRTQILKSVNGNSFDSDAAIWHLLMEKFQQTCYIDNSHIPINRHFQEDTLNSDLARRSTAPLIFDAGNTELVYNAPNTLESIRPQLDPCDLTRPLPGPLVYSHVEPEIRIDDLEHFDENEEDEEADEHKSAQIREKYNRAHGLRRHTIGRPDLLMHGGPIPTLASKVRFAHQLTTIEPSLLTNRLTDLQQQQQHQTNIISPDEREDPCESPSPPSRNTHSTSYNGLCVPSFPPTVLNEFYDLQQRENNWLSPPALNNYHMNRRASDSGAHLLLFQQHYGVTGSNTLAPIRPTHIQSPSSNRSSRGSITRGAPITPPTFSITPHEDDEDQNRQRDTEEEENEKIARYLSQGKRHTVCEPGPLLGGKARRSGGGLTVREAVKERGLSSRRASDTSSNFINGSTRAHFERLYNNAVNLKAAEEDDLTASSLQELQKLQKQVQKYPNTNPSDASVLRRAAAAPSPTNSLGLHRIQEEHQRNSRIYLSEEHSNQSKALLSPSEALNNGGGDDDDDHEHEMECDVHMQPSSEGFFRTPYFHPPPTSAFYCTASPLLAQHLAIPTTTSSFMP